MRRTKCFFAILALVSAFLLTANSWGEVYRATFDTWTDAYVNAKGETIEVVSFEFRSLADTKGLRGPDSIRSVKVKAPDGTIFDLTGSWSEWRNHYFARFSASAFTSLTLPGGRYQGTVVDKSGNKLIANKTLPTTLTFLPIPVITDPLPGATVSSLIPTISWDAVDGAQLYCLELVNASAGEPVYYYPHNRIHVYRNSFTIPLNVLFPNTNYSVRIEARNSDKSMTMRSRSPWINFTTPAAAP